MKRSDPSSAGPFSILYPLLLSAALGLGSGAALADASLGASVPALLDYARTHNPAFAVERAEADAARERIGPAGALPDPSFQIELMDVTNTMRGGGTSLLPGQVGETRYRIVQPLPAWGKRELAGRAATALADSADAGREAAWLELAAAIKTAWLRYYVADREAVLARDTLTLLEGIEETALARYRLGLLAQQPVLRAQREITAQRVALVSIEQARELAASTLNALLARPPGSPLAAPLEPPALPPTPALARLMEQAANANPALIAQAHGTAAARFAQERTLRDRYPDFSVGLTNNRPRGGEDSWDLMVEVMIPLQQSARRSREREAQHMVSAAESRRAAVMAELNGELGRAHATYAAGRSSLNLLRGSLMPQAEATRDAANAAFSSGRVDFDTVLESERQLVDTRMAILRAELETRLALTELEKIAGDLQ